MPDVLTKPAAKIGGGGIGADTGDFDGGGGREGSHPFDSARLGLWVFLGSVTMLFAAFTSAYLVRSAGTDWAPLQIPSVLWISTAVLIASSVTMELARRSFQDWKPLAFRKWMVATFVLGVSFICGQLLAWQQLAEQGVFLQSHPHSSFFYVFTAVHALHVLGGIAALLYVLFQSWRYKLTPGVSSAPALCATYWHFIDVVWIYLFVVLFVM